MHDADVRTAYQLLNNCDVAELYYYIPLQYIPMNDKAMPNGHIDVKPSIAVLLQQWRVLNDAYNRLRYYFLLLTVACSSVINEFDDECNATQNQYCCILQRVYG